VYPNLAAQAINAGLVDECHLFITPIVVGAGKRSFPNNVRCSSNYSMNVVSATASFTSTAAPGHEETCESHMTDAEGTLNPWHCAHAAQS